MTRATTNKPSPVYVQDGTSELGRALTALSEAVADHVLLSELVGSLRHRLEHQRLQLAVLGQFKRAKSTFINALLGASLLPIAVVPLTAVPVFISWRSHGLVRARFADHRPTEGITTDDPDVIRQFLFRFISEEANQKNQLGVVRVDLFYPSPILAEGLILVDTPGVGSTLRHNTEAALRVLPESDAAIFVVSADPPITEVEIEYLKQIKSKAAKLFFVLNKIDYLRPEERGHVSEFVKQALDQHDLWPPDTVLFRMSAAEGLDAKRRGNQANLKSSGVADVARHLSGELAAQKTRRLEAALRSRAADIISEVIAELRLKIRALEMPLRELAETCQAFQQRLPRWRGSGM